MADMNLEDIMYRVGHKDSKMTRQVYNYFYPEREGPNADQFAKFIEKENIFSKKIVVSFVVSLLFRKKKH